MRAVTLPVAALLALAAACGTADRDVAAPPTDHPRTEARSGPLGGGGAASCVERYSPAAAVAERAFAFDGTVVAIGEGRSDRPGQAELQLAGLTFRVHEWYAGGPGPEVTVDLPPPRDEQRVAELPPAYDVGTRLLVSGEPRWGGAALTDAIAWGCGFTRYRDERTAAAWAAAAATRP